MALLGYMDAPWRLDLDPFSSCEISELLHLHPGTTLGDPSSDHADHASGGPAALTAGGNDDVAVGMLAGHHPFECLKQWCLAFMFNRFII